MTTTYANLFLEVVKNEIERRGLTQKQVSEILNINYSVLNKILLGKQKIDLEYAAQISAYFEIDLSLVLNIVPDSEYDLRVGYNRKKVPALYFSKIKKVK